MNKSLEHKTAVVTGAASGIGRSVCQVLAKQGSTVFALDLDEAGTIATCEQISKDGGIAEAHACDVSNQREVIDLVAKISTNSSLDILVNSAGIAHVGTLQETTEEDLDRLYRVNVKGTYNTMYAVIKPMLLQQSGIVINIASVASSVGVAERFAYSMSKGAVLTMTYSVARDYVKQGIRCNCISPARVHTEFVDGFLEKHYRENKTEMMQKLSETQPIGRMGKPSEIASLVAYLCSDAASFITGSNVLIDGGFVKLNS